HRDRHRVHEPLRLRRSRPCVDRGQGHRQGRRDGPRRLREPDAAEELPPARSDLIFRRIIMTNLVSKWNYPTTIRFGAGRIRELPQVLKEAGIANPLFVTDPGLAKLPVAGSTLKLLADAGVPHGIFSDVKPNPVETNLTAGIAAFKAGGHDGVVAFGGGSALDLGKLIAFQAHQSRPVWDFEDIGDWWTRADGSRIAPIVAVPTTAGTGSEVGRAGVLTHEASHTKKVIFHPKMLPAIVIADPELTAGMPPFITAGTGMD